MRIVTIRGVAIVCFFGKNVTYWRVIVRELVIVIIVAEYFSGSEVKDEDRFIISWDPIRV